MKTSKAVALEYNETKNNAPKIIASGKGAIAEKIIQKAKEFNVPIFANKALVESLIDLDIDKEIPAELYQAVVEVFVWLAKQDKKVAY